MPECLHAPVWDFFSPTSAFAIITMDTMMIFAPTSMTTCQYSKAAQYVSALQVGFAVLVFLWNTQALSNILRCFSIYQFKRSFVQIKQAQEAGAKNASSFFQLPGSSGVQKNHFITCLQCYQRSCRLIFVFNNFAPKRNKTISDGGITVDFSIIKVQLII